MEVLFLRFSHLSENIFDSLNNQGIARSTRVSRIWHNYLEKQNFVSIRRIKTKIEKFLCTKKGVDIDEKDVPFLNQSNRDPLDFGPNGFGFRNFIASISSEVDDDLLSKASFFVEVMVD